MKFYGLGFKISVRAYRGVGEIRSFIKKNNIYKKCQNAQNLVEHLHLKKGVGGSNSHMVENMCPVHFFSYIPYHNAYDYIL